MHPTATTGIITSEVPSFMVLTGIHLVEEH